jgi:hypothetical protein
MNIRPVITFEEKVGERELGRISRSGGFLVEYAHDIAPPPSHHVHTQQLTKVSPTEHRCVISALGIREL